MQHPIRTAILLATLAAPAFAQQANPAEHAAHHPAQVKTESAMTEGEVRRVDKDARKITLRHGPIKNLDMPAMTMVFQVKDAALLDKVNTGDKVKFNAEKIPGGYAVTEIETVK